MVAPLSGLVSDDTTQEPVPRLLLVRHGETIVARALIRSPTLYILQVRPMVRHGREACIAQEVDPRRHLIGRSHRSLGHG